MFKVIVCGGPCDGEPLCDDGWINYGAEPAQLFATYEEAQAYAQSRQPMVNQGEYGKGATLAVDPVYEG